ncbi:hypothetical protein [Streptomyces zaomyceticus]|uniref:hypothetical protein n=1 Tax=Streptomyces zaomyceticus TaxID=68286 RepID=UPI0034452D68
MARLATNVHVTDASGTSHVFGPADEVPEWAQVLITNPKAWAEAPSTANRSADPAPKPATKRATPRRKAAPGDAVHSG